MTPAFISSVSFEDVPFQGIVEQSLAGVYVVQDERFVYANETFASMFGYTKEAFVGRRMVDCVTPESAEEVLENYRLRISGEVAATRFGERHRLDVSIEGLEAANQVPPTPSLQVFRIFQEALTNVAKHAMATSVEVRMALREGIFHLTLKDNGTGMKDAPPKPGAIGLLSMRERAMEIGGSIRVSRGAAHGTELVLKVALPSRSDDAGIS